MNYLHNIRISFFLATLLASFAGYSLAEEAGSEDEQQQGDKNSRDGSYLSIGIGSRNFESPLREELEGWQVVFNGRYQWKGFFAELVGGPTTDKNLPAVGYNFYSTDHWNLDFIAVAIPSRTRFSYVIDGETKHLSSNATRGVGFRAIGSWGNTVLQAVAMPQFNGDFRSDSAVDYASLWLGHRWQIKNWSVNGLVGAKYRSSSLMDYHFGVTEGEADEVVAAYEPSSGIDYTAQLDLTYPISKNVLFQIYSKHTLYSDELLNSPKIELARKWDNRPEKEQEFGILLNYVF